jgi:CO/xanthine dehydrogenase FAD-binding subunit
MRHAGALAREEIAPISDVRGSAEYRALLGENILVKFAREAAGRSMVSTNGR